MQILCVPDSHLGGEISTVWGGEYSQCVLLSPPCLYFMLWFIKHDCMHIAEEKQQSF